MTRLIHPVYKHFFHSIYYWQVTFTQLPDVTIRTTSKVSSNLGLWYNIENQIYCKDPTSPRSREGHPSVTDFWKSSAAQHEKSQLYASRVSTKGHTPVTGLRHEAATERGNYILWLCRWLAENVRHNTSAPYRHTAGRCQRLHHKREDRLTRKRRKWHLQSYVILLKYL